MTLDLTALPLQAREAILGLQAENGRLQTLLKLKDEQIRFLNLRRWGPKADQLSEAQLALLPQELVVAAPEVEGEAARPDAQKTLAAVPRAKAPRGPHPGRATLPTHLERREEIIACAPKDCACSTCGLPRPVIGYEIREEIVNQIGRLYDVEREARARHLAVPARWEWRQSQSQPIMRALKTRILQIRQEVTPAGALAKACAYALGQWTRLEEYLHDGQLEIDNNWCEGAMRPIALGRKNWLHVGDESAGPKIAAIISIVETCRRLDLKLREYLQAILPKLGDWPITRVAELTPSAWKAARNG